MTDNEPFKDPARRIPPALFQEVKEHLKEMIEAGAIRPSHSPYSSNVVIVRKKDGTIRFCVDFRKLNNKTIKDAYAIPRVEDSLHLLAGARYFSKLDLRSGYWQVEIKEEDKHKTAFQVGNLGFFEFNRMPFGLCNAPASFQRLMERCMGDLNLRDCLIYLDDVIIFSSTFEEHLDRLEEVFTRLRQHNLKLKPSKCEFLKSEVTYLGHVVSEAGIRTDPDKTKAIKNWPIPRNVKEVRAYLGFTGYYRRFIKDYAKIARPLNDLLIGHCTSKKQKLKKAKKTEFVWTEKQQDAFDTLKEKLMRPPVLAYADYSKPFKLHTDASTTGLGAVLYQNQEGMDRVVAYASRSLKQSERNYPAHKLEFLALKWAVTEKFHDYLYGANFDVVTDNNPLTYVFTTAKLDATGQRWLAELSNYNCSISYRCGKQNSDADGLSRIPESITIFPDVLKTICHSANVDIAQKPYCESLTDAEQNLL
ncbi:MAG: reverse transcriptase, partial [Candidatus Thiodiazotropha taylori]|nr:reverse transcriptase [Candidatus Thiodiazotropha taylori]MCW4334552.1 reverse transcriptase [Candidatus Thiodiazotropha endolucinida]